MNNPLICYVRERFSDPQVVLLAMLALLGVAIFYFLGHLLAPALASLVLAYLLDSLVRWLTRLGLPRLPAVTLVFIGFMLLVALTVIFVAPLLAQQIAQLINKLPSILQRGQQELMRLPQQYPGVISEEQLKDGVLMLKTEVIKLSQAFLAVSLTWVRGVVHSVIYLILIPLLIFFFLKDKDMLLAWVKSILPQHRYLADCVWSEVNQQTGNYIRGKVWEILLLWATTYVAFLLLGLDFALLLSFVASVTVVIPYVGVVFSTVPIALVAYAQFGWTAQAAWPLLVYFLLHMVDGNLIAPLLFAHVVAVHPVGIIIALLVFGGLWGVLGIFFAIPLATLVQALARALLNPRDCRMPPAAGRCETP